MADLIDSLIGYVNDIKPYHTKIYGVEVEYVTTDRVNVTVAEDLTMRMELGLPIASTLESLAVAVGDDDGWDTSGYDSVPFDTILTDRDGFFIDGAFEVQPSDPDWNSTSTYIFDDKRYRKPTGFVDYAFVTIGENLTIEGQIITRDVPDEITLVNFPWDSPLDGIDVVEYGTNYIVTDNDHTAIFSLNPNFSFEVFSSTFNDGWYTVDYATYDFDRNETTIYLQETGLDTSIPDGFLRVGFYDADSWDSDPVTQVPQPAADVYARSTICEGLTITDGTGWDDPNVGWDATIDDDYIAAPSDYHNAIFFDQPSKWDNAYNIIDAKSTACDVIPKPICGLRDRPGFDGGRYDALPWDSDDYLPGFRWDEGEWEGSPWDSGVLCEPDALAPTGIVVFSPERMPVPNPRNIGTLFTQTVASNTWVIDHNLGYYPVIRIFRLDGTEFEPLTVVHTSQNQIVVSFNSPQTGMARVV